MKILKIDQPPLHPAKRYKSSYTYDRFINDFKDIQIYIDEIYKIIDEADKMFFCDNSEEIKGLIKSTHYDIVDMFNMVEYTNVDVYDISKIEDKEILKENLKINLSIPDEREPIDFKVNHKNITYDTELYDIEFIKGNMQITTLSRYDGFIYDYREEFQLKNSTKEK